MSLPAAAGGNVNQTVAGAIPLKGYIFYSYCENIVTGTPISFPVRLIYKAEFHEFPESSDGGSYDFEVLSLDVEWFIDNDETGETISIGGAPIENGPENVTVEQSGTHYTFSYDGPSDNFSGSPDYGVVTMTVRDRNSGKVFTTAAEFFFVFVV